MQNQQKIWNRLNDTTPFRFAYQSEGSVEGPSSLYIEGNRKLIFEWQFKGRTTTTVMQAIW